LAISDFPLPNDPSQERKRPDNVSPPVVDGALPNPERKRRADPTRERERADHPLPAEDGLSVALV
jgi:hypothetical protein